MSEESEKPFEATPQRIEKAKRDGDVARSSELAANLSFACAGCAVAAVSPLFGAQARAAIAASASGRPAWAASAAVLTLALMPLLGAAVAAIAAGAVQGGLRGTGAGLKLSRLNPLDGIRRILSRETLAHGARAAAAFAVTAAAIVPAVSAAISEMLHAGAPAAVAAAAWSAIEHVALAACATGSLFAVAEYAAARGAWLRRLRMTLEERKREAKEQDGDPFARGRRRALHRALLRGSLADVKDASFVVANPTHLAVALVYRPPGIAVPRISVRAAGEAAVRVRALAEASAIPVVENVELARALFRDGRVGEPIARAYYVAVAEIVTALGRAAA